MRNALYAKIAVSALCVAMALAAAGCTEAERDDDAAYRPQETMIVGTEKLERFGGPDALGYASMAETKTGLLSLIYNQTVFFARFAESYEYYEELGLDYADPVQLAGYEARFLGSAALLARSTRIEEGDAAALAAAYDELCAIVREEDPLSQDYPSDLIGAGVGAEAPGVEPVTLDEMQTEAPEGRTWNLESEFYLDEVAKRPLAERLLGQMQKVDSKIWALYNESVEADGPADSLLVLYEKIFVAQADLLARVLAADEGDGAALQEMYGEMLGIFGLSDDRP